MRIHCKKAMVEVCKIAIASKMDGINKTHPQKEGCHIKSTQFLLWA